MIDAEIQESETVAGNIADRFRKRLGKIAVLRSLSKSLTSRSFVSIWVLTASIVFLPPTWAAENDYESVLAYKYREGVMQAIGGHMDAITVIMRSKSHEDDLALHTKSIAGLAKVVPSSFPAGSDVAKSEALAAIWEEPVRFGEAVERFIGASDTLHHAVQTQTGVRKAFADLGKACKSCHDSFRE